MNDSELFKIKVLDPINEFRLKVLNQYEKTESYQLELLLSRIDNDLLHFYEIYEKILEQQKN